MGNRNFNRIIALTTKIVAIAICLIFIAEHYFFEITPTSVSPTFVLSFIVLIALNWYSKEYQKKGYFTIFHIPIVIILLFFVVHFRSGIVWALNTFPLRDANTVLLTLEEPFDDFAYLMIKQYLKATIPQALVISVIITVFLYTVLNNTKKRLFAIGVYFAATIALFISDIPIPDYIHILNNEPQKNASYSKFFVENYVNPDSVKITAPDKKRNLILIYIESMETTFTDKEHGGNQEKNLIPEITELALHNLNFGKDGNLIGGGIDARGSNSTFASIHSRTLGIPFIINYEKTPVLHHYKSLYKILNENGYKQIFFQGNGGLYKEFQSFVIDQKVDEAYGPEDLIQRLNLKERNLPNGKTVPDKDTFKFANQILDTISEPFSLTFFTIDTHAPQGMYDPNCIISDNNNKDEHLKASIRCASKELGKFITALKTKKFYENTSIIIFGDHLFMGTRLVNEFPHRKWIDIFLNAPKVPISENRLFSDIDMFPTMLSSLNFEIDGSSLGFGTDLFSDKQTLLESIGLDSLNKEIETIPNHLVYESYQLRKRQK
ncbi:LTA synthase family protein [Fibrobacter sp. UWEL]|uniref:LTA synthase family protein n=1 Tax=Fibrobacter sp. UWEL TaxID=1896209 RepID=UPI00091F204E|nr:LTA synthase family protein [Fibrobacter sp. UWEL]SHL48706.1 phosphoglycerol transferase [Fibrobacter sp. UWEL]